MATIVLQTVGAAVGGMIGGPVGAMAGRALGALAGAAIDNALFSGDATKHVEGPRLKDIDGLTSTEGAPIPRVYGRARIGGQLIWATRLEEVVNTKSNRGNQGGKGMGGPKTVTTTYSYFANLAVGLCEGRIAFIRRVWADGRELDLSTLTMRVHKGSDTQNPDPLVVAKEGADHAPAYRGLAYVVFERLPLADFGNRVPQFSFEVVRPVDGLNRMVRAVCLIPGASEFGYDTEPVMQVLDLGKTRPENRHQFKRCCGIVGCHGGPVPEPQARLPGGELVRERSARGLLPHRAARGREDENHGRCCMVGRRSDARRRESGVAREGRTGLWRHALRRERDPADPQPEGSRP